MRLFNLLALLPSLTRPWGAKQLQPPQDGQQHVLPAEPAPESSASHNHGSHQGIGFAAFGDSYSAGIGTGVDGTEDDCRHGLHAHPALIAADLAASRRLPAPDDSGANASLAFQWLSCTGATTEDVLTGGGAGASQIDALNASLPADFALLSVGGNDLGFFDVINACVFRFYGSYSGTCAAALAAADALLASPAFEDRLRAALLEILDRGLRAGRPRFAVTVTGYARFFDAETRGCDERSLGVWWGGGGPPLTREVRRRLNGLVDAANARIGRAVDEVNGRFSLPGRRPGVLFVDYDAAFEGHRLCEPGVEEPAYNRTETWFFLVGGEDNARNETAAAAAAVGDLPARPVLPLRDAALADPDVCLGPAQRSGDWGELALCYMAMARQRDPSLRPAHDGVMAENSMWYVPTSYGKVLHPRTLGHEAIRDKIYEAWRKHGYKNM
ncbi:Lipase 1 [Pleurostoma richardsiae]|uniref:Lipase 1 n=1 Tax=Pleurostoma richardsiae TaxID=41990 RepID=A0AA38S8I3_9PEZI|nr:Lipase 1 [Pleurostoma richardsiae]